jgi:hypothetical protein
MPIRFLLEEDHAFSPDDVKILVDAFQGTLRALGLTDPEQSYAGIWVTTFD